MEFSLRYRRWESETSGVGERGGGLGARGGGLGARSGLGARGGLRVACSDIEDMEWRPVSLLLLKLPPLPLALPRHEPEPCCGRRLGLGRLCLASAALSASSFDMAFSAAASAAFTFVFASASASADSRCRSVFSLSSRLLPLCSSPCSSSIVTTCISLEQLIAQ